MDKTKDKMDKTKEEKNNNTIDNNSSKKWSNWDKYVYTLCMFYNHLAYGMNSNIFGPAMVDMKYIFNTSMDYISLFNTFNAAGYLLGSLFGFLYLYINRQKTVTVMISVLGIGTALIIYCPNIWTLYLCSLLSQMGAGAWDNANSIWLIEMWQQRSPSFLQFSQFMYGLGCILGPLLAEPFLTGELKSNNATNSSISSTLPTFTTLQTMTTTDINESVDRRAKLEFPFIVGGALQLISPAVFLIMLFIKKYKPPIVELKTEQLVIKSNSEDGVHEIYDSSAQIIERPKGNRILLIGLIATCLGVYGAVEIVHFQFSSTYYQYISLQLSAQKAAQILSVMATSYTIGRCVSAFIAIKIKPEIMLMYHYLIIILSILGLYFGQNYEAVIWVGNVTIGFGFSAMWPAIFAFGDQYIKLTNRVGTVFCMASGLVNIASPFILGPYIENSPIMFILLEIAYFLISLSLFMISLYYVKVYKM